MEQRRFHRVTYSAPGELSHHGLTYRIKLQNLSLRGAMLSSNDGLMIPVGDTCTLSLAPEQAPPFVVTIEVVHSFFSMVGVKFVDLADGAETALYELLQKISGEPETLRQEWEEILGHHPRREGETVCARS